MLYVCVYIYIYILLAVGVRGGAVAAGAGAHDGHRQGPRLRLGEEAPQGL